MNRTFIYIYNIYILNIIICIFLYVYIRKFGILTKKWHVPLVTQAFPKFLKKKKFRNFKIKNLKTLVIIEQKIKFKIPEVLLLCYSDLRYGEVLFCYLVILL